MYIYVAPSVDFCELTFCEHDDSEVIRTAEYLAGKAVFCKELKTDSFFKKKLLAVGSKNLIIEAIRGVDAEVVFGEDLRVSV